MWYHADRVAKFNPKDGSRMTTKIKIWSSSPLLCSSSFCNLIIIHMYVVLVLILLFLLVRLRDNLKDLLD